LPRATPQNMLSAIRTVPRPAVARRADVVSVPAIGYPLIDASGHVKKPETVRCKQANLHRLLARIAASATSASRFAGLRLTAPPVFRRGAAARGVFPLSLGRK